MSKPCFVEEKTVMVESCDKIRFLKPKRKIELAAEVKEMYKFSSNIILRAIVMALNCFVDDGIKMTRKFRFG